MSEPLQSSNCWPAPISVVPYLSPAVKVATTYLEGRRQVVWSGAEWRDRGWGGLGGVVWSAGNHAGNYAGNYAGIYAGIYAVRLRLCLLLADITWGLVLVVKPCCRNTSGQDGAAQDAVHVRSFNALP